MGAYLNEVSRQDLAQWTSLIVLQADPHDPDWKNTFWGTNYARLLKIKREVDPDDVFWCAPCVGNERWRLIDNQLCRVES
jgi:hypothetical protein